MKFYVDVSGDAPRWWHYLWPPVMLALAVWQSHLWLAALCGFAAGAWAAILLAWRFGWRQVVREMER